MYEKSQFHKMSLRAVQGHNCQGKGDRVTSEQICTAQDEPPLGTERKQKPQGGQGRDSEQQRAWHPWNLQQDTAGEAQVPVPIVLPMGLGGTKKGAPLQGWVVLHLDGGAGYINLYMGEKCMKLHTHTHSRVHVKLEKIEQGLQFSLQIAPMSVSWL